jgi:hypothetical protein
MEAEVGMTTDLLAPVVHRPWIEFLRLPKPGSLCPICGLSRSFLNSLILPTEANGFKPPVKSFVLRKRGARTGVRLVSWESLRAYILQNEDTPTVQKSPDQSPS